jgi:hypothetical protein
MGKNQLTEDVCALVEYFNGLIGCGKRKRIQHGKEKTDNVNTTQNHIAM